MIKSAADRIISRVTPVWIVLFTGLVIPRAAECGDPPEIKWSPTRLKSVNETVIRAIAAVGAGDRQDIDSSMRYLADTWKIFVDQEQESFEGEIASPESLRMLINKTSNDIQRLVTIDVVAEAAAIRVLLDEIRASSDAILRHISKPVLLVFTGAKCKSWPNCKAGQRTMESVDNIASKFAARIRISIVDVKQKKELAKRYKIMLTPTLVYIDANGREAYRKAGESTESLIEDELNSLIAE